jgi:hypothetical protein
MENLPIDIVLVRHGESEGNLAHDRSALGDDSLWTPELMVCYCICFKLTIIRLDTHRIID